jgi:ribulose-phosphate 3-epimerase
VDGPRIVASVLPADFSRLGQECAAMEAAGVDRIQWDVMDGEFVPNLTIGPDVIAAVRPRVRLGFEAHLMVAHPDRLLPRWAEAGCELIIVHAEACPHLHRTLAAITALGVRAGVALNPATPPEAVAHVLDLVDLVLVMTVDPGFGGQAYLPSMRPKIARVHQLITATGRRIELEVDGGIGPATIADAAAAGAGTFCAGSALFAAGRLGMAGEVARLRALATTARPAGSPRHLPTPGSRPTAEEAPCPTS